MIKYLTANFNNNKNIDNTKLRLFKLASKVNKRKMKDDDIEELDYTPLKKKKGGDDSIRSSQITYSSVEILYKNSTQNRSQRNRTRSQISQKSKLRKNTPSAKVKNELPDTFKKPVKPNLNSKFKQEVNLKTSKIENKEKFEKSEWKGESSDIVILSSLNSSNNNKINILDDDIIPDIDFTQLMDTVSSHDSNKEESLPDFFKTEEKNSSAQENFSDKELVIQEDIHKVDSWLLDVAEQNLITPQKTELSNEEWDGSLQENKNPDPVKVEDSNKACVHFHFHVNDSNKFVQPTIEHFFKKSSSCVNNTKPEVKFKKQNSNTAEVSKTWQNIMKPEKSVAGPSGINQNSMNFHKETEVMKKFPKKKCPFYKFVEGTKFVVDGFNYGHIEGVSSYFLSHFHYDHYMGLDKNFKKTIYCSQITANLVKLKLNVEERFLNPIPLGEPRVIDEVEVTLYDANHCPGSVMFLFKLTSGTVILHVGDFRANPDMESISALWNVAINVLYLDTTYLDPSYDFLSQEDILEKCRDIAEEHTQFNKSSTLFVVGSYTIGKEKVFKAIAKKLNCKIYAQPYKEGILRCLNDDEINSRLTKNKLLAQVHVISMRDMSLCKLKKYLEDLQRVFKVLVGIKPTGWEHNTDVECDLSNLKPKETGNIFVYGLPYSEHSSYSELKRFYQFLKPIKTIPTVNNGKKYIREKMGNILKEWKQEWEQLRKRYKSSLSK